MADYKIKRIFRSLTSLAVVVVTILGLLTPTAVSVNAIETPMLERAKQAYVYNIENQLVMYEYNADQTIFPASMTKIMTAILAIEQLGDRWDEKIAITDDMKNAVRGQSSIMTVKVGEEFTVGELVSAVVCGGMNDAAYALAFTIGGSIDKFVKMMNDRAEELGCKNTHFTNPTGIHDDRMTTTLRDMSILALHAYHMSRFMDAARLERFVIGSTNMTKRYRYLVNKNYFVSNTVVYDYYNPEVIGMNAGGTSYAGNCVVAVAAREGITQLVMVAGGETDEIPYIAQELQEDGTILDVEKVRYIYNVYIEAQKLLDWSYDNYSYIDILKTSRMICEVPVDLSSKVDHVTLLPERSITEYMPNDLDPTQDIVIDWDLNTPRLEAPVERGQVVGEMTLYYDGRVLDKVNLVAQNTVDRDEWMYVLGGIREFTSQTWFRVAVVVAVVLAVIYVFAMAMLREYNRKRRKRNRVVQKL